MKISLKKHLNLFLMSAFGMLLILANLIAIFATTKWNEINYSALLIGNLIFIATGGYFVFIYHVVKFLRDAPKEKVKKMYRGSMWLMSFLLFVLPFFFMIHLPDSLHPWDYFTISNATTTAAGGPIMTHLAYLLRYPNNQFFTIFENFLFAPLAHHIQLKMIALTGFSALLTVIGVLAGSFSVKALSDERSVILYNLIAVGFTPFWFYGAQLYSDTMTLPFVSGGLLFLIYALKAKEKSKKLIDYSLASLIIVVGSIFKPTVAILLIAALIFLALNKKWKQLVMLFLLFFGFFVGGHYAVKATIAGQPAFSQKANEEYNFPLIHWIAMSWAPANKTGGFNLKIREYTESIPGKSAKNKADTTLFLHNIKEMGVGGIIRQIGRKLSYTWTLPDLNGSFYTYAHENPLVSRYFDYLPSKKVGNITGGLMLKAAQMLYWLPIVGLLWSEIFRLAHRKNWHDPWGILALSTIGLSLFLIIWEANARYLYDFMPLMLALVTMKLEVLLKKYA